MKTDVSNTSAASSVTDKIQKDSNGIMNAGACAHKSK